MPILAAGSSRNWCTTWVRASTGSEAKSCWAKASRRPANWAISSGSRVSAKACSITAGTSMSDAERARNSRSTGSPVSDSTAGMNVSLSAARVWRWVSESTIAATDMWADPTAHVVCLRADRGTIRAGLMAGDMDRQEQGSRTARRVGRGAAAAVGGAALSQAVAASAMAMPVCACGATNAPPAPDPPPPPPSPPTHRLSVEDQEAIQRERTPPPPQPPAPPPVHPSPDAQDANRAAAERNAAPAPRPMPPPLPVEDQIAIQRERREASQPSPRPEPKPQPSPAPVHPSPDAQDANRAAAERNAAPAPRPMPPHL